MSVDFRPLPLLTNPHVQTVVGSLLPPNVRGLPFRRQQLHLADGDRLLLYDSVPASWQPGDTVVLAVHGLGGCHRSGYLVRLAKLLLPHGYRVVRMDLRGAGNSIRWARQTYNAGSSGDVRTVLHEVHRWSPNSPLVLAGFSLGGNIALKLAGEVRDHAVPMLRAVVAVNPPVDLTACSKLLQLPVNQFYNRYFARRLVRQVQLQWRYFPDLPRIDFPRGLGLREFDDLHTAPRGGYADAADYYRRASALPLINDISVPVLILTARDDPFVAPEPIENLVGRPNFEVRIAAHGGHLGFLGIDGYGGVRWAEPRIAEWIWRTVPAKGLGIASEDQ